MALLHTEARHCHHHHRRERACTAPHVTLDHNTTPPTAQPVPSVVHKHSLPGLQAVTRDRRW